MGPISEKNAQTIRYELRQVLDDHVKWIDAEIQDGGDFLLVSIETDFVQATEATEKILKTAAAVVSARIAPRFEEHAWMVNIGHGGALIDSETGGLAQDRGRRH